MSFFIAPLYWPVVSIHNPLFTSQTTHYAEDGNNLRLSQQQQHFRNSSKIVFCKEQKCRTQLKSIASLTRGSPGEYEGVVYYYYERLNCENPPLHYSLQKVRELGSKRSSNGRRSVSKRDVLTFIIILRTVNRDLCSPDHTFRAEQSASKQKHCLLTHSTPQPQPCTKARLTDFAWLWLSDRQRDVKLRQQFSDGALN